jgi:hypothetical protein
MGSGQAAASPLNAAAKRRLGATIVVQSGCRCDVRVGTSRMKVNTSGAAFL